MRERDVRLTVSSDGQLVKIHHLLVFLSSYVYISRFLNFHFKCRSNLERGETEKSLPSAVSLSKW